MKTYYIEKVAATMKVSLPLIKELKITGGLSEDDFVMNKLTLKIEAIIESRLIDERTLLYACPPPSFFDWLFRRTKIVKWNLSVKEYLKQDKNSNRVVIIDLIK